MVKFLKLFSDKFVCLDIVIFDPVANMVNAYKHVYHKANNLTLAASKNSDQPGHQSSLTRVFAVH